jgi:hypothetical protein
MKFLLYRISLVDNIGGEMLFHSIYPLLLFEIKSKIINQKLSPIRILNLQRF